jgi:hypothetical protein
VTKVHDATLNELGGELKEEDGNEMPVGES